MAGPEIQQEGFSGSRGLVAQWAAQKRMQLRTKQAHSGKPVAKRVPPMAPSRAVWLLLRNVDELDTEEQSALARMTKGDVQVALVYTLGQSFFKMVRDRQADQLSAWIDQATGSKVSALKSFAQGLQQDLGAVKAASELGMEQRPNGRASELVEDTQTSNVWQSEFRLA